MGGAPLRAAGVPYTGINRLYLWAVADHYGYGSRYWMTWRQAIELGGKVRKGETAEPSIYFNSTKKTAIDQATGEESSKTIRFMRAYSVFNASQIDGLPPHFYPSPVPEAPPTPSQKAAAIERFFSPVPADIRLGGDRAFYSPGADYIQLPHPNVFNTEDGFVATKAHELGHWSGHASRLAREFGKRFGDKAYAFEELVAEQVSARICYELGLPADLHESHASYVSHWLEILKADKTAIITAAAKADQAFNHLAAYSGFQSEPAGEEGEEPERALRQPALRKGGWGHCILQWKGSLMSCDIDYRYRRALQPDGLTTFENALRALNEAVDDVRLAGRQAATCPAVLLLTRHLQRIADGRPTECEADDQALRSQCIERLAELKHRPAIIALVKRGIDYRPEELRHYRREGTRALRQIAAGIGLEHADYRISYYTSQEQLAGEHVLEADGIYVRISPERFGEPGLAWRNPFWKPPGAVMRKAPITALADIPALTARIARELKIAPPAQPGLI